MLSISSLRAKDGPKASSASIKIVINHSESGTTSLITLELILKKSPLCAQFSVAASLSHKKVI